MSSLLAAVTSVFSSSPPPAHPVPRTDAEVSREVAPESASIAAAPTFPTGPSSTTTLDYKPEPQPAHDRILSMPVRDGEGVATGLAPAAVPAFQGGATEPRTAPTAFITDTTANSQPAPFPLISVGPVLGLITESTARVLIECNTTMTVQLRLTLIKRNVRKTRANAAQHAHPAAHDVHAATTGVQQSSDTNHAAYHPTPSPDSHPVNAAPAAVSVSPLVASSAISGMDSSEAAIRTGASSGSPVSSGTFVAAPSSSSSSSAAGQHNQHPFGSPGTTAGAQEQAARAAASVESYATPATQPSPTETPQQHGDPAVHGAVPASTFAPSRLSTYKQDEEAALATQPSSQSLSSPVQDGRTLDKEVHCTANRVATVTFVELEPDCRYVLDFVNVKSRVTSSFTTLLPGWPVSATTPLKLAIVSCNLITVTKDLEQPDTDLWLDLSQRVSEGEIDYVLHIGDQVYADAGPDESSDEVDMAKQKADFIRYRLVFKTGVEMLQGLPLSDWPTCAVHIKELYRQLYRETWSHPPTAFVLANAPQLMIYDDHDFRDDWGNEDCDSDPSTPEYYVGRCAHEIMCEYQRQLWDNVDFNQLDAIKKDFHFHVFGEHGVIFLDVRGPRSLHKVKDDVYPYVGSLQWQEVKAALSDEGIMRDVRSLLIICPAPIVFLPTTVNDLLGKTVVDDALGHWSSAPFKDEQIMMLNLAQAWKAARPGRELTFIGGDVHVGGHTEVTRDGSVVFQQLVTSAIANYRLSKFEFFIGHLSQDLVTTLEDGWAFKHRGFTRQRNYGLITVSTDERGPVVQARLVAPKGEREEADNRNGIEHLK